MSKHMNVRVRVPIESDNPSIERIESLCVKCGLCTKVCKDYIGVLGRYDLEKTHDTAVCIHCGQCANVCPTASIVEKSEIDLVKKALADPEKIVVVTMSPAVRVSLGEAFGMPPGAFVEAKAVGLLRVLGVQYVLDTDFGADLTVVEEASEFVSRVKTGAAPLPQFTSCCPAWVKFCELFHPELLSNLSEARSPIGMQGATIKSYFAKKIGVDPQRIFNVALAPCTAKKFEIRRSEMNAAGRRIGRPDMRDTDCVITTRELANWAKEEKISLKDVSDSQFDSPLGVSSGAGVIFGNTGGVTEAVLRSTYFFLTGKNLKADELKFQAVRGLSKIREAQIQIAETTLRAAVVYGTQAADALIEDIRNGKRHYDLVEVMTCPGGCIGGGGQPKTPYGQEEEIRQSRIDALYKRDEVLAVRTSHENPEIKALYEDFYGKPLSDTAQAMLHTHYVDRSAELGEEQQSVKSEEPRNVSAPTKKRFRCTVCGYIWEGEELPKDYVCPLCGKGIEVFEEVKEP